MQFHAIVLFAVPLCFGQAPPPDAAVTSAPVTAPPEVDSALRARVKAFLDNQSQGNFRKAYDLVAEDSKDYYFSVAKEKASSFTIDEVQYSPDLSTATVKSTMKRQVTLAGHPVELPQLMISQWKVEKGEWVWYHDPSKDVTRTVLGDLPADSTQGGQQATAQSTIPKDMSMKAAIATIAKIAPKAAVDKKSVTFILGKEAADQIIFNNGNPGFVHVFAEVRGVADTITVEPGDMLVKPQVDVPVKITYKPLKDSKGSSLRGEVRFTVEPFGSVYVLPVIIAREAPAPKPAAPAVP